MQHFPHAVKTAVLFALLQVPAFLGSSVIRNLVDKHPAWAVYVPLVAGLASLAVKALDDKQKPAPKKK